MSTVYRYVPLDGTFYNEKLHKTKSRQIAYRNERYVFVIRGHKIVLIVSEYNYYLSTFYIFTSHIFIIRIICSLSILTML